MVEYTIGYNIKWEIAVHVTTVIKEFPQFFINYYMQRWARAYRDSVYHTAVETNNASFEVQVSSKAKKYDTFTNH